MGRDHQRGAHANGKLPVDNIGQIQRRPHLERQQCGGWEHEYFRIFAVDQVIDDLINNVNILRSKTKKTLQELNKLPVPK